MKGFFQMAFKRHRNQLDVWVGSTWPACLTQQCINWGLEPLAASSPCTQNRIDLFNARLCLENHLLPYFGCQTCGHSSVGHGDGGKPPHGTQVLSGLHAGLAWMRHPVGSAADMTCVLQSGSSCIWCWKILSLDMSTLHLLPLQYLGHNSMTTYWLWGLSATQQDKNVT